MPQPTILMLSPQNEIILFLTLELMADLMSIKKEYMFCTYKSPVLGSINFKVAAIGLLT